ncbi:fungal-specific transcription factor domain-containing protein [Alternaria rosae]|uniref:fungal-specific transcription factor domain-containing protein n=1 Tax=Alternaria rosae TaxID=1187941 RepID=UPI001E8D8AC0|nr:fungal-specific transcription factor domain-containing protein [Alternaria rosae]KAH6875721.1 fungal-specific transcription factor domain-containing protein [Alternaria rosae]
METTTAETPKLERRGSAPVKRRVSRACDHCHRMRTRCNGQAPCSRCIELEYVCQYNREKKRRGKVPRHIQKQREEAAASGSPQTPNGISSYYERPGVMAEMDEDVWSQSEATPVVQHFPAGKGGLPAGDWQALNPGTTFDPPVNHMMIDPLLLGSGAAYPAMHAEMPREELMYAMNGMHLIPGSNGTPVSIPPEYANMNYPMQYQATGRQSSPHSYGSVDTGSPQSGVSANSSQNGAAIAACRYPVLGPLLPHLGPILNVTTACDLLEFYFQSSSSVFMEPVSPYILGSVFRKRSFLRQHKPRKCSPALLSSMLWVAAQTSEASYLTSSPSARAIISQKLWKLTVDLLKPLVHSPSSHGFAPGPGLTSAAHDAFGVDRAIGRYDGRPDGAMPPTSTLDDVATYINLGVVTSASEYKAASLRWWNAAWSLARELKLGRELPQGPAKERETAATDKEIEAGIPEGASAQAPVGTPSAAIVEEMKEERRRLWWLLYMVDRHLGLCYNRPLAMLDNECEDLFQPVPDTLWQAGEFYTGHPGSRKRGLNFECTSHDIFGFFLPLMTILGDIVDLNAQKNHPRFGQRTSWELHEAEITRQLERYAYSIEDFKAQHGCGSNEEAQANSTPDPVRSEWMHQTRKVAAYATHIMHVLHILLHGKWDPVALLEDDNMWICSQSFLAATSNAISAAHAVEVILDVDPDLSFMPYLFGMYLLQGSLILLLLADKLSTETNDGVIRACETIVRAHEAAVVTLNTEYQRNFRKVMISTLAQIKGHGHAREMTPAKRREVLSLYRWTSLGNGLAI